ncbi:MAG: hypothetical protein FGM24_09225 [Candidatus Kapabacteria bacterium]|nr:hypothetical protein [Candidatus Kapabacteria bacterium]
MSFYGTSIQDCLSPRTEYSALGGVTQGLSGIAESAFATLIGTAPDYAASLTDAVKLVYVRANYNANVQASGGTLPWNPTKYYSEKLVGGIIGTYRTLAGTGVVVHLTGETIASPAATDVYNQVTGKLLKNYPNLKVDTTRTILREFFYATVDQKIDPEILLPSVQRYPTAGAQAMMAQGEEQRKLNEAKAAQENQGFLGQFGAAFLNLFRAPGDLASAATTTAKVAGIGVTTVVVTGAGFMLYAIYRKVREFDVNRGFAEQQRTVREVGPAAAAAIVRRGR